MNHQTDKSVSIGGNLNIGGRLRAASNAVFTRNVRIEGWLDAPNLRSPCLGLFESRDALRAACQEPRDGSWALVLAGSGDSGIMATVYTASGGEWQAADTCPLGIDIDISGKADKAMFVTLSESEYEALETKDNDTYYFIYE